MPILENQILPTPPPPPDKAEILQNVVRRIQNMSKEYFETSIRTQREGIEIVFENPYLEPQEILDALVPNAPNIIMFHGKLTDFINDIASVDGVTVELKYPTNSFTVDLSAGTITLTDQPYQI